MVLELTLCRNSPTDLGNQNRRPSDFPPACSDYRSRWNAGCNCPELIFDMDACASLYEAARAETVSNSSDLWRIAQPSLCDSSDLDPTDTAQC